MQVKHNPQAASEAAPAAENGNATMRKGRLSCDLYSLPSAIQRPNKWADIKPSDFGPEWDYELENHITRWIITPISTAALEWCYAHLPEHLPRWGAKGFVIEAKHLNSIVKSMTRDKLMSAEEYERAMEEANMLQLQGERNDWNK